MALIKAGIGKYLSKKSRLLNQQETWRYAVSVLAAAANNGLPWILDEIAKLPDDVTGAIQICQGHIDEGKIIEVISNYPEETLDILELASKYSETKIFKNNPISSVLNKILNNYEGDLFKHPDWKVRALLADKARWEKDRTLLTKLHMGMKNDPNEEVRVRMRNAFSEIVSIFPEQDKIKIIQELIIELKELPDEEIRYSASAITLILAAIESNDTRISIVNQLREVSLTHENPYTRKSALKLCAKSVKLFEYNHTKNFF